MKIKTSVDVACFLAGRAKDLLAPLYYYYYFRVMKITWCTIYPQFISSVSLYKFRASR